MPVQRSPPKQTCSGEHPVSPIASKHNSSAIKANVALEQQSRRHSTSHRTRTSTKNDEPLTQLASNKASTSDAVHGAEANMSVVGQDDAPFVSLSESKDWTTVGCSKQTKRHGDSGTSKEPEIKKPKSSQESNESDESNEIVVFIKGRSTNICKYATQHCTVFRKDFDTKFGRPCRILFLYKIECLKVYCRNTQQKDNILTSTYIGLLDIVPTRPYAETRKLQVSHATLNDTSLQTQMQYKRVAIGIPHDVPEDVIKEESKATTVTRFKKSNGELTMVTLLTFSSMPPSIIYIGYTPFRLKAYIPQPIRCDNCQRFGHKTNACNAPTRCSFCSGSHKYVDCPKNKQTEKPKCCNCGHEHSAAFRGCPQYEMRKQALVIKVTNNITYKEAIAEVKNKEHTNLVTSAIVTEQQTEQQTDNGGFKIPQTPAHKTPNAWNTGKTQNNVVEIHQILLLLVQSTLLLLSKIGGDDVAQIVTTLTSFTTLLQKHT